MNIVYENRFYQYQSLVIPPHKRTLKFRNKPKLVEIPKSIAVALYEKEVQSILLGYICDFELSYYINFGSNICTRGKRFTDIYAYISWYWNSRFEGTCRNHLKIKNINSDDLMQRVAKFYLQNKGN